MKRALCLLLLCLSVAGVSACATLDDDLAIDDEIATSESAIIQSHWKFEADYTTLLRSFGFERMLDHTGFARNDTASGQPRYQQALMILLDGTCTTGTFDPASFGITPFDAWMRLANVATGATALFREMSHGRFVLAVPPPRQVCRNLGPADQFVPDRQVIEAAIAGVVASGYDFSDYDDNNDRVVTPDELMILVSTNRAGYAAGRSGCVEVGAGLRYCGQSSVFTASVDVGTIGHEVAHLLGAIEMYGPWAGAPLHRGATIMGNNVGHLDAWHKLQLGWQRPDVIDIARQAARSLFISCADLERSEVDGGLLFVDSRRGNDEYFLVEARCNAGLDRTADTGLAIWQVRQDGSHDAFGDTRLYFEPVAGCAQARGFSQCGAPSVCLIDSGATVGEVNARPCLETRFVRAGDGDRGWVPLFWRDGSSSGSAVRVASEVRENGRLVGYQMEWRTSWTPLPVGPRATGDTMLPDQVLGHDQFLRSADGRYTLYFQADGNLVLVRTHDWSLLWASGSRAAPGELIMQSDGNLVIYADGPGVRWASGTMVPNSRLVVQNDGNVVIYRPDNTPVWATHTAEPVSAHGRDIMFPNQVLRPNESMRSSDGRFTLYFQGDGNLVLVRTRDWSLLWASRSSSTNPRIVVMQSDGNLVIYDAWRAIWASGTNAPNSRFVVQNDGNAVIYRADNRPVWATNTAGR